MAQVGHFYFGAVGQFYIGANTQWSVGVQVASNEAHTDGIAQRFHTPGDALQSIRIAR
ncbi:Hypothetical Protein XCAW_01003 [Xanthomonas citri subsp. citri Aw12879]|nr:Hypothetical Protein XCAW_01003 [Xanthomonas citri subsp. citri Aw12879]